MRVTPRLNEEVNEEWISDKARFQYDGLKRQRLDAPMVKTKEGLELATWESALAAVAQAVGFAKGNEIKAIAGKLADAESIVAMKDLLNKLGSGNHLCEGFSNLDADIRSSYLLNSTIFGVEDTDAVLLVRTPIDHSPRFSVHAVACFNKTPVTRCVGFLYTSFS